jgi:hypothetical protein
MKKPLLYKCKKIYIYIYEYRCVCVCACVGGSYGLMQSSAVGLVLEHRLAALTLVMWVSVGVHGSATC